MKTLLAAASLLLCASISAAPKLEKTDKPELPANPTTDDVSALLRDIESLPPIPPAPGAPAKGMAVNAGSPYATLQTAANLLRKKAVLYRAGKCSKTELRSAAQEVNTAARAYRASLARK